jgi:hypothetical protein
MVVLLLLLLLLLLGMLLPGVLQGVRRVLLLPVEFHPLPGLYDARQRCLVYCHQQVGPQRTGVHPTTQVQSCTCGGLPPCTQAC